LLEAILDRENMMAAYRRVVANGGAAGVDGMTVGELKAFLVEHWPRIKEDLLAGGYRPRPVRRVDIPKPGDGKRTLGIPTVLDRLIQQAMHQVLSPVSIWGSRRPLMASGRDGAPTRRCWLPAAMWRRAGAGWWTSTWRSSSIG